MERRKRVYPNQKERNGWLGRILIGLTVWVVLTGLMGKQHPDGFFLETKRESAAPRLDEAFDETMTEAVIELPARSWYALQVGVFEKEETAKQSSAAFQRRGAAGYLWPDGRYRVLAAAYPEKEDAQQVRGQLQDQHGIDSYLYEIAAPSLTLRMQGMQGQLEIFQAAIAHSWDIAGQIQQLSVSMDRQEISAAEAVSRLKALGEQMDIVAIRLSQRFPKPQHGTVQALAGCLAGFERFVSGLSEQESAVTVGMKLKYQVFETLSDLRKVYDTLDHT